MTDSPTEQMHEQEPALEWIRMGGGFGLTWIVVFVVIVAAPYLRRE